MAPITTKMQKLICVLASDTSGPSPHETGSLWGWSLVHHFFPVSQYLTQRPAHAINRWLDEERMPGWKDAEERGRGGILGAGEERSGSQEVLKGTLDQEGAQEVKEAWRWLRG